MRPTANAVIDPIVAHLNVTGAPGYAVDVQNLATDNTRLRDALQRLVTSSADAANDFEAIGQDSMARFARAVAEAAAEALA